MVTWVRVDGETIPSATAFMAGALTGSSFAIGTLLDVVAGDSQNTITFSSVTGATAYNIYWRTTAGVTKLNGTKIAGVTSPHTHSGLSNGTTYYYIYTAENASEESSESNELSGTPNLPLPSKVLFGMRT